MSYDTIIKNSNWKLREQIYFKESIKFLYNIDDTTLKIIIDIINGNHFISYKFINWFIIKYCYKYNISININNIYLNISECYNFYIKLYKKENFDIFKRGYKFNLQIKQYTINTSLCQLLYFKWLIEYNILYYILNNYEDIYIIYKSNNINKSIKNDNIDYVNNLNLKLVF